MNTRTLSMYVLRALADAQIEGRRETLDTLVDRLEVRRRDVRSVVTSLHQQGLLDVIHMRLTLQGFAVGSALLQQELPALRRAAERGVAAA